MRKAATELLGEHDFTSLRSPSCTAGSPIRQLLELSVHEEPPDALSALAAECGRSIVIRARSKAFLKQQVHARAHVHMDMDVCMLMRYREIEGVPGAAGEPSRGAD